MLTGRLRKTAFLVLVITIPILACATNTPVAVAPPQPTRTPFPTFTVTPIPPTPLPTPTGTNTPLATDTPTPEPMPTPKPTDTAVPPTNTPVPPTNTPAPPPTPIPPTATPVPAPVSSPISPVATPTATPVRETPPGRYVDRDVEGENNCAHIGVYGKVIDDDTKDPVPYVTIEVTGDEKPFKGPYTAQSNEKGDYSILIGELSDKVDGIEFKVKVIGGDGVKSEDKTTWTAGKDCEDSDSIQIMRINWAKKPPK